MATIGGRRVPVFSRLVCGLAAVAMCGCHPGATPADFVGTWRFTRGHGTVVIGSGGESAVEVDDVTGNTFEVVLGTGGAELHWILEDLEGCTFNLNTTGNWASAPTGANATCHFVDQPAEYDVDLEGVAFGVSAAAGTGAIGYALSGILTFDGDVGNYRLHVVGEVEKVP